MIYRFPKKTFRVQNSLKMNWKNVIKKPTLKITFVSRSEDNWKEGSLGTRSVRSFTELEINIWFKTCKIYLTRWNLKLRQVREFALKTLWSFSRLLILANKMAVCSTTSAGSTSSDHALYFKRFHQWLNSPMKTLRSRWRLETKKKTKLRILEEITSVLFGGTCFKSVMLTTFYQLASCEKAWTTRGNSFPISSHVSANSNFSWSSLLIIDFFYAQSSTFLVLILDTSNFKCS